MYVLHFTIFTGIESILPGMSDLGVMIMIGFWNAMHREGKELLLDMYGNTLRGDAVPSLTRPYNGKKSAVTGCLLHCLLLWELPKLLIALFLMMCTNTHFRQVPAYVEEVRSGFKRGCIEGRHPSKTKKDRPRRNYDLFKSTVQLMTGAMDWTKVNLFQGERKIDGRWMK